MDLQERMAKTVAGQVTWANPELGMKCRSCRHCSRLPHSEKTGTHICELVKLHTKKRGVAFDPDRAIACTMFTR